MDNIDTSLNLWSSKHVKCTTLPAAGSVQQKQAIGARLLRSLPVHTLHRPCRLRQDRAQAGRCASASIAERTGNVAASGIVASAARPGWSANNERQVGAKAEAAKACNVNILKRRRSVS